MSGIGTRTRLAGVVLRTQPDTRLVLLAREGHEPAVEEIVRRYRPALVAFASGIVPAHRAEDVVQESLTRALTALRDSSAVIALRPWLYTIVRHRSLNDLRDERIHDPLDDNIDGVPQPPDVAVQREELASLVTRINGLPDAQREALVQLELEGRSYGEIATSMGASPGAVRQLVFRARASLRNAAGLLIPAPLVRSLLTGGSAGAGAAGLGAGGVGLVKPGMVLVVGALALGSGVVVHDQSGVGGHLATAATKPTATAERGPAARVDLASRVAAAEDRKVAESGSDDRHGEAGDGGQDGPSANSGPGGGDSSSRPGEGSNDPPAAEPDQAPSGPEPGAGGGSGDSGGGTSGSGDDGSGDSGSGDDGSGDLADPTADDPVDQGSNHDGDTPAVVIDDEDQGN